MSFGYLVRSGSSREPLPSINLGVASEKPPNASRISSELGVSSVNYPPGIKDHPPSVGHVCRSSNILFPCRRNQQPPSERYDPKT